MALGVVAALVWAHERMEGEAFRARFNEEVGELLEREVGFESLDLQFFPPALVVREPFVGDAQPGAAPFLEARSLSLRFRVLPLLDRSVVVTSVVVDQATLRLRRTRSGFGIPVPEREADPSLDDDGFTVQVRQLELRDASLLFDDRLVDPPVAWRLDAVQARIDSASRAAPKYLDASVASDGGRLHVEGTVTLEGQVDLEARLDRFPLAPLDPFLGSTQVAGRVTGRLSARGDSADPAEIRFEGRVDEASLALGEGFSLAGRVGLRAVTRGGLEAPRADLEIDASDAEIRALRAIRKPTGDHVRAKGRLRREPGRPFVFAGDLEVQSARFDTAVEFGERTRIRLDAPPFALSEWHPLVEVLADLELSGSLGAQSIEILTGPLEIRGEASMEDVALRFGDRESGGVRLAGGLVAEGDRLRTDAVVATLPGGVLPLEVVVDDLAGDWRFRVRTKGSGVEANDLLGALGRPDLLYGPIAVDADLQGSFVGEKSFRDRLAGRVALRIAPGRLRGISLFEAVFRRAEAPDGGSRGRVGRSLERFYSDGFDSLETHLQLADGVARTDDLRLESTYYAYSLNGSIRLADLGLDARGEMVLGRDVVASLFAWSRIPLPGVLSGVTIPLPAIRGTLTDPQPEVDWRHFWRTLFANVPGRRLMRGIKGLGQKLPAR